MNKSLLAILIVLLVAGAYWYGESRHKAGAIEARHHAILDGSSDSPIIITDGSSIHFDQLDGWTVVGNTNIFAQISSHIPHRVRIGYCPAQSASPTDESKCTVVTNGEIKLASYKTLDMWTCDSNPCNSGTAAAAIHWVRKDPIVVAVNAATSFVTGNSTGDGDDAALADVHQKYVAVSLDGGAATTFDCSTPSSKQVCSVRICYAPNASACRP